MVQIMMSEEDVYKRQEQGKKTTTVDGRYFNLAENLLYSELELVLQKNKDEIYQMIKAICEA